MRALASTSTISTISTPAHADAANQLLAALPPAEFLRMKADMDWVALARGRVLHEAGAVIRQVYFPVTATVSLVSSMQDGDSAEVAVVGRDGVVGVCAFMGGGTVPSSAVVQSPGHAWRMAAATIEAHAARSDTVMRALLRYTQALFGQMAQTSACRRHHLLDQQLCRWLLLQLDRLDSADMRATHEGIAGMLGVRREGVTEAANALQRAGLIRNARGLIQVLDRAGLEARCCECYAVLRRGSERLRA